MDYKYIEQLLDKYWNGLTSAEEEKILKAFFEQDDLPAGMNIFKPLFHEMNQAKKHKSPKTDRAKNHRIHKQKKYSKSHPQQLESKTDTGIQGRCCRNLGNTDREISAKRHNRREQHCRQQQHDD